jgi:NAD(P)-dependent dehydrogenase (short-subunit alcohol dehydrogenase family)
MSNQDPKAIFITGSSSGLGRASAKLFASKGWKVIASMRDPAKERDLAKFLALH